MKFLNSPSVATLLLLIFPLIGCQITPHSATDKGSAPVSLRVRVATYNIWTLSREKLDVTGENGAGSHPQLLKATAVLQHLRPDILLINEIDGNDGGTSARLFRERYLAVPHGEAEALHYPYLFTAPVNTGLDSGLDLNQDGQLGDPIDAWGWGDYSGQYAMAVFSRYPIQAEDARTLQRLLWKDLPGSNIADGRGGRPKYYSPRVADQLRLTSKSQWDVPVKIGPTILHLLTAHPTPPTFDDERDHNGRRNFDELKLLKEYLDDASWIADDQGTQGGLDLDESFVILGDLNADPNSSEHQAYGSAIGQILDHSRVQDPSPISRGGVQEKHPYAGDASIRTNRWGRLDYVLPSADLKVMKTGVFWPGEGQFGRAWIEDRGASDHFLVWVDLALPADI